MMRLSNSSDPSPEQVNGWDNSSMSAVLSDTRLNDLVDGIVKIAGGDLTTRLPVSDARDQLDAVIVGFNSMAAELLTAQGELETRVKSRTAMLMEAFRKMELMALTDPLTQLRNRTALETALESSLATAVSRGAPALLLLDLDSFKGINDTLGHGAGDAVLKIVAERLRASVSKEDTVARLGGDEFAIVLQNTSASNARKVGEEIVAALARPAVVEETEISIAVSIGIAIPKQDDSAVDLILYADTAMYAAKHEANASVVVFSRDLLNSRQIRSALAAELQTAISNDEMVLYYQPVVALNTGELVGVEALVRWQHPRRGLLMPDEFIDLAEEIGAMAPLAVWVLQTALAQLRRWRETVVLDPRFSVQVNISATQLQRPELLDDVQRILLAEGIEPANLVLEITEYSMVTGNEWDLYSFRGLRQLGVGLSIDDFGTGYSSISYLRTLPVDGVKLDKSLLSSDVAAPAEREFIAAILQLVKSCSLAATFEGIETGEQAAMLAALGCDTGQGYYFSRPVPASGINAALVASLLEVPWHASSHSVPETPFPSSSKA